ncbi:hypothetical protein CEXT_579631 [Caerostris extrusa]|uniref:Uncharacterized protein n=1 Tax=Caerostris extrusa TaxID=172846 RepID=A0AAV4V0S5_CAEEX|nr:hypothetical protein CEXT_579631 [Caerostris extrusa]
MRPVVMIHRKIPYCIQNYYARLNRLKKNVDSYEFNTVQNHFETLYLPKLPKHDHEDYKRFKLGLMFEDVYDFPHGQMQRKYPKATVQDLF